MPASAPAANEKELRTLFALRLMPYGRGCRHLALPFSAQEESMAGCTAPNPSAACNRQTWITVLRSAYRMDCHRRFGERAGDSVILSTQSQTVWRVMLPLTRHTSHAALTTFSGPACSMARI
jgi:hypothetical protein